MHDYRILKERFSPLKQIGGGVEQHTSSNTPLFENHHLHVH
jgi:hypothetical protein